MNLQEHLFTLLIEEAAEIIKAATKLNRFGEKDVNPVTHRTAVDEVVYEINDLFAVLDLLKDHAYLPRGLRQEDLVKAKKIKIKTMMEYSISVGALYGR